MTPSYQSVSALSAPRMGQTYWLLALAMGMTVLGAFVGATFALPIIASGWIFLLFLVEVAILLSARIWMRSSPLNIILFLAFPFLSGLTITPFLFDVLTGYANGASILLNAAISTTLLCVASAVYASVSRVNLSAKMGMFLLQALIGLIVFGLLQLFIPSLRGTSFEMILSGVGIVTFALFLSVDLQRAMRRAGSESPFLIALSLYLDIFNLFLYVVRFMLAFSGGQRR